MKALFDILCLERRPEDRIMKAELARELRRFEECLTLLDHEFEEGLLPAVNLIKSLAGKKDIKVHRLDETE